MYAKHYICQKTFHAGKLPSVLPLEILTFSLITVNYITDEINQKGFQSIKIIEGPKRSAVYKQRSVLFYFNLF